MILSRLEIENFRQIHGRSTVHFAQPGARNVTVFLGENAAGKSTLLHALGWCLYGEEALRGARLRNPDDLASHRAVEQCTPGGTVSVRVQLVFEHDEQWYSVERSRTYQKLVASQTPKVIENSFWIRLSDNIASQNWTKSLTPNDDIARVLPKSLLPYFFFAGEAAGEMVDPRLATGLKEAVEGVLDLTVLRNTEHHLESVRKDISDEMRRSSTHEGGELEEQIAELETSCESNAHSRSRMLAEHQATQRQLLEVEECLGEYEETRPLIEEQAKLGAEAKAVDEHKQEVGEDLKKIIRTRAYEALLEPSITQLQERLADAYRRDDLPARIKPGFVDELLVRGHCICGADLHEGSPHREGITHFRQGSGLDRYADALQRLDGRLKEVKSNTSGFHETFLEKKATYDMLVLRLSRVALRLREIDRLLEGKRSDEHALAQLLQKRRKLAESRDSIGGELQRLSEKIEKDSARLKLLKEQREVRHKGSKQADRLRRQEKVLERLRDAATKLREGWMEIIQTYLDGRIQETYKAVSVLDRKVSFDRAFQLAMHEFVDGRWVESDTSGANQAVLALCFVASFIELADQTFREDGDIAARMGGRYPMVMDAPFAKMGEFFSAKVPTYLAKAVPQVVIMTNERQWSGAVEESLREHVGRSYLLHLHTNRGDGDRQVPYLGKMVDYVALDETAHPDYSVLKEIE